MSVTMNEMNVEVLPPTASAAPPSPSTPAQKKGVDLSRALEVLRERHLRLGAD